MKISDHALRVILPLHLFALLAIPFFEAWWLIATFVGWVMISGFGVAIGLHRYFSHKSFVTTAFWHRVLAVLGCLGAQGSPIFWAALHRGKHHRHADTPDDPHSPIHGVWQSYFGWQINLDPRMVPMRAAHDLLRDKFLLSLHQNYYTVLWGVCLIAAVIHPMLFLFGLVLPMVISMHEENIVNVVCHTRKLGYRRYDTHDDSVNNWVLGTLFWGQGFHNTHHAQPSAYDFGRKWWEVDFSKFLIRMIAINGKERPAHDR